MLTLPPLSLYVHLPWCVRRCPYCDFNAHQRPSVLPEDDYISALLSDLDQDLPEVYGRPLVSIFIGGGTPSLFSGAAIGRLLDGVRARFRLRPGAEITLETNPGTAEFDRFDGYLEAGVNRISFGVQSFDDAKLKVLGRIHDGQQAQTAFAAARAAGVRNINIDLMYALPRQDKASALQDVHTAIGLAPEHISYYQLTLEPNTVFAAMPPADLPTVEEADDIEQAGHAALQTAGFARYEVSAFAQAERHSRHNINTWRFGDYLGIGAGAHGKWTDLAVGRIRRRVKQRIPRLYMETASSARRIVEDVQIEPSALPFEFMLNALRLRAGFARNDFAARTGLDLDRVPAFAKALNRRLLVDDGTQIRATDLGYRFLNDTVELFA